MLGRVGLMIRVMGKAEAEVFDIFIYICPTLIASISCLFLRRMNGKTFLREQEAIIAGLCVAIRQECEV